MQISCTEKEFVKNLKKKEKGEYYALYIKSNTLLFVDVF